MSLFGNSCLTIIQYPFETSCRRASGGSASLIQFRDPETSYWWTSPAWRVIWFILRCFFASRNYFLRMTRLWKVVVKPVWMISYGKYVCSLPKGVRQIYIGINDTILEGFYLTLSRQEEAEDNQWFYFLATWHLCGGIASLFHHATTHWLTVIANPANTMFELSKSQWRDEAIPWLEPISSIVEHGDCFVVPPRNDASWWGLLRRFTS